MAFFHIRILSEINKNAYLDSRYAMITIFARKTIYDVFNVYLLSYLKPDSS